jgi:hypothetical protein
MLGANRSMDFLSQDMWRFINTFAPWFSAVGTLSGIFIKRYAVQSIINDEMSSTIPVRLKDGEEAKFLISLNKETNWLREFGKKMLYPFPWLQARFIKIQAYTSLGGTFEAKIEKSLRQKILDALEDVESP